MTLALVLAVLAVGWIALRAADDVARLDRTILALDDTLARQRDEIDARPTAAELAAVRSQLTALRVAVLRVTPNQVKLVTDRFIESAETAVAEPIYGISAVNLFMPHYMRFCARFDLAGTSYQSCMSERDFEAARRCYYDELVVGASLPECFR